MAIVMDEAAGVFPLSEQQSQRLAVPVDCCIIFATVSASILTLEPWHKMVKVQPVQGFENAVDVGEVKRRCLT